MDSLTQLALGAACGEAVAGRRVGNRAALWGGVSGTLPDLDILAYPFLDPAAELHFHRGITHGLLFGFVAGPLFGWLVARFYRGRTARAGPNAGEALRAATSWRLWGWVGFWALFTHPLLDAFTVYGTQLLQPFSDLPVAWSSLFIIDPLYTVWLLLGLGVALLLRRENVWRHRAIVAGLALSTAYVAWSVGVKRHVERVVTDNLTAQGITQEIGVERVLTNPLPFSTLAWTALVDLDGPDFLVTTYAFLDTDDDLDFRRVPQHPERLDGRRDTRAVETLLWFSRGYYATSETDDRHVLFHDLRFGRLDGWQTDAPPGDPRVPFVFTFRLYEDAGGTLTFEQRPPPTDALGADTFRALWDRIRGRSPAADSEPG